jgi:hypothetical protein
MNARPLLVIDQDLPPALLHGRLGRSALLQPEDVVAHLAMGFLDRLVQPGQFGEDRFRVAGFGVAGQHVVPQPEEGQQLAEAVVHLPGQALPFLQRRNVLHPLQQFGVLDGSGRVAGQMAEEHNIHISQVQLLGRCAEQNPHDVLRNPNGHRHGGLQRRRAEQCALAGQVVREKGAPGLEHPAHDQTLQRLDRPEHGGTAGAPCRLPGDAGNGVTHEAPGGQVHAEEFARPVENLVQVAAHVRVGGNDPPDLHQAVHLPFAQGGLGLEGDPFRRIPQE